MTAAEKRIASGDPVKRMTYRWQWWLAAFRHYGGDSSHEASRYARAQLRRARGLPPRANR